MIGPLAGKLVMFSVGDGTILKGRVLRDNRRTIVIEYQGKEIKRRKGRDYLAEIYGKGLTFANKGVA